MASKTGSLELSAAEIIECPACRGHGGIPRAESSLDATALHHLIMVYTDRPGLPYSAHIALLLKELQERRSAGETTADATALARVTFAKNRYDRCTWILYLLEDEQISVGKAAEWLREYIRDGKEGSLPPQQIPNPEADELELMRRMTAAMREADETFERVGGSTRHHVRDCLLPILGSHGLRLRLAVKTSCFDPRTGIAKEPQ